MVAVNPKEQLIDAIAGVREEEAARLSADLLAAGAEPQEILAACREAMGIVGRRFEQKEYFLPELIIAGDIVRHIGEGLRPLLAAAPEGTPRRGRVVIGTVAGDIHDIGKDIVAFMLDVNGFEVLDLGVDVPAPRFAEAIREWDPDIVALSGFLTLAFDQMKATIAEIDCAGLRQRVRIMIGGAPMDEKVTAYVGADAFGADASAAVRIARRWIGASSE